MMFGFNAAEVFNIAIEIEENGRVFYRKARERIADPEVKEIFRDLEQQEMEHKRRFQEMKEGLPRQATERTVWDPENELDRYLKMMADQHVFRTEDEVEERLRGVNDAVDALRLAIEFEKDSVIFFLSMQDATEEEKGRELIGLLIKEEQSHLRRLSVQLQKLTH